MPCVLGIWPDLPVDNDRQMEAIRRGEAQVLVQHSHPTTIDCPGTCPRKGRV